MMLLDDLCALASLVADAMGPGRVVIEAPPGTLRRTPMLPPDPPRTSATRHLPPIEPRPDREEDEHVHHVESVTRPDSKGRHEERCYCGMVRSVFVTNAESGKHWRGEWRRA